MSTAPLPPRVDCYQAARMLGVAPSTIRSWARKGWITRTNPDDEGRALYDPDDLLRFAETRGVRA